MTGTFLPFIRENSWFWGVALAIIYMKLSIQRTVGVRARQLGNFSGLPA